MQLFRSGIMPLNPCIHHAQSHPILLTLARLFQLGTMLLNLCIKLAQSRPMFLRLVLLSRIGRTFLNIRIQPAQSLLMCLGLARLFRLGKMLAVRSPLAFLMNLKCRLLFLSGKVIHNPGHHHDRFPPVYPTILIYHPLFPSGKVFRNRGHRHVRFLPAYPTNLTSHPLFLPGGRALCSQRLHPIQSLPACRMNLTCHPLFPSGTTCRCPELRPAKFLRWSSKSVKNPRPRLLRLLTGLLSGVKLPKSHAHARPHPWT